jgi:GcrA cell cycle regulator
MKGIWTKERIALLKRLWSEGKTATAIAARLDGISRSAVLGKIFRLRLGAGTNAKTGGGRGRKNKALGRRDRGRPLVQPPPRKQRGKSLLELDNESCRWPFGRPGTKAFHFCGATGADLENGRPYCEPHMRRAYLAPPPKPGKQKNSAAPDREFDSQPVAAMRETSGPSQRLRRYERRSRR